MGYLQQNVNEQRLVVHKSARGVTTASNQTDPECAKFVSGVSSSLLFGHLRAATDGETDEANSHPFHFSDWGQTGTNEEVLWMHNGGLSNYKEMAQRIRGSSKFPASLLEQVKGTTDSELAGAIFMNFLHTGHRTGPHFSAEELSLAMKKTIHELDDHDHDPHYAEVGEKMCPAPHDENVQSSLNFAASDGNTLVATRFRTCGMQEPPTLYYTIGSYVDKNGVMRHREDSPPERRGAALLVSSEPLYHFNDAVASADAAEG